jgi:hypothetical protein
LATLSTGCFLAGGSANGLRVPPGSDHAWAELEAACGQRLERCPHLDTYFQDLAKFDCTLQGLTPEECAE